MKLLVSKRTNTFVPTNASPDGGALSVTVCSASGSSRGGSGFSEPSSAISIAGRLPSENVESFSLIPSSRIRKSEGFKPFTYLPLLSVTVKLRTTRSTLDLNTGCRASWANSQIPPPADASPPASNPKRAQPLNDNPLIRFLLPCTFRLCGIGDRDLCIPCPNFRSHRAQTFQQRGPIFQVRCEDPLHHFLSPLRDENIQLSRLYSG